MIKLFFSFLCIGLAPPALKKWFDEVLIYGWAFGSKSSYPLEDKKIALAITTGVTGYYKHTLEEVLVPFELTLNMLKLIIVHTLCIMDLIQLYPKKLLKKVPRNMYAFSMLCSFFLMLFLFSRLKIIFIVYV